MAFIKEQVVEIYVAALQAIYGVNNSTNAGGIEFINIEWIVLTNDIAYSPDMLIA